MINIIKNLAFIGFGYIICMEFEKLCVSLIAIAREACNKSKN